MIDIDKLKESFMDNLEDSIRDDEMVHIDYVDDAVNILLQDLVKNNIALGSVSKCECGETKDLITVCEDCTYKMVSEGN